MTELADLEITTEHEERADKLVGTLHSKGWDAVEVAIFLAGHGAGWTVREVSDALGRTRNAILGFAWRHGYGFGKGVRRKSPGDLPPSIEPAPEPKPKAVLVKPAERTHCLWVTDPKHAAYCGNDRLPKSSWCAEHVAHFPACIDD